MNPASVSDSKIYRPSETLGLAGSTTAFAVILSSFPPSEIPGVAKQNTHGDTNSDVQDDDDGGQDGDDDAESDVECDRGKLQLTLLCKSTWSKSQTGFGNNLW